MKLGLLVAGASASVLLASGGAAADSASVERAHSPAARGQGIGTWTQCAPGPGSPDNSCIVGDYPTAVLRAKHSSHLDYKVCLTGPSGNTSCRQKTTQRPGKASYVGFAINNAGEYKVSWYSGGDRLDTDGLHIGIGD